MNNLWPWRNLLASVCIARLPTGPSLSLSLSLSRKEKIRSNHKTAGSPSLKHIYHIIHFLQPADPNTSNHVQENLFSSMIFNGSILDNQNISIKRRKPAKRMRKFLILRILFDRKFSRLQFPRDGRLDLKKLLNVNTYASTITSNRYNFNFSLLYTRKTFVQLKRYRENRQAMLIYIYLSKKKEKNTNKKYKIYQTTYPTLQSVQDGGGFQTVL